MFTLKQNIILVTNTTRKIVSPERFVETAVLTVMLVGFTGYLCNKFAPQLVGVKNLLKEKK